MNQEKLENKIKEAYNGLAPDIKEEILKDSAAKTGVLTMTDAETKRKPKNKFTKYIAIAACLALVLGSFGAVKANANKAWATVTLDVNPSIEIVLNKNEKVVEVKALNQDAEAIIGSMDFKGSSLDVTVNALVGSLLINGYIDNDANSILVSVSDKDSEQGKELETELVEKIDKILSDANVQGSILAQVVTEDEELASLSTQYNISEGKASLILEMTKGNETLKFEDLVNLTINELNAIAEAKDEILANIEKKGSCSLGDYIDIEYAKTIALKDAGVALGGVNLEASLDWEDGKMVYEIEFKCGNVEYEYEIDALTGEISWKDIEDKVIEGFKELFGIGESIAKEIVMKHAGLLENQISNFKIDLEQENGSFVYEIEFEYGGQEYEYKINVNTGDILKVEIESN